MRLESQFADFPLLGEAAFSFSHERCIVMRINYISLPFAPGPLHIASTCVRGSTADTLRLPLIASGV
jgi:hypothetical protein